MLVSSFWRTRRQQDESDEARAVNRLDFGDEFPPLASSGSAGSDSANLTAGRKNMNGLVRLDYH